jgi:F-type H+-transporting ATPase subunit b
VNIAQQLGIDSSIFVQLAIIVVVYFLLSAIFFKPFLKLIEARHRKTVEDREAAAQLMQQADAKLEEYKKKLAEERTAAKREYESAIEEARKEESAILAQAREEAKKITHEAADAVAKQYEELRRKLEVDVESFARTISEKLISRKV